MNISEFNRKRLLLANDLLSEVCISLDKGSGGTPPQGPATKQPAARSLGDVKKGLKVGVTPIAAIALVMEAYRDSLVACSEDEIPCPPYQQMRTSEGTNVGIFATVRLSRSGTDTDQIGCTVDELPIDKHPHVFRKEGLVLTRSNRHARAGIEPPIAFWVRAVDLTQVVRVRYWFNTRRADSLDRDNENFFFKVVGGQLLPIEEKEYSEISSKYNAEQDKRTVSVTGTDYT
jgi:hypothetical protein